MDDRSKGVLMVIGGVVFGVLMLGAGVYWFGGAFVVVRGLMLIFSPSSNRSQAKPLGLSQRPGPFDTTGPYHPAAPYYPAGPYHPAASDQPPLPYNPAAPHSPAAYYPAPPYDASGLHNPTAPYTPSGPYDSLGPVAPQ